MKFQYFLLILVRLATFFFVALAADVAIFKANADEIIIPVLRAVEQCIINLYEKDPTILKKENRVTTVERLSKENWAQKSKKLEEAIYDIVKVECPDLNEEQKKEYA